MKDRITEPDVPELVTKAAPAPPPKPVPPPAPPPEPAPAPEVKAAPKPARRLVKLKGSDTPEQMTMWLVENGVRRPIKGSAAAVKTGLRPEVVKPDELAAWPVGEVYEG